ncbi:MAG TPA: outer membrane beta-barrel protein [Candidatus Deferrimicrobium sp.]|nr:outer membrane beta-barrel protein [Candidatus Deferrimicrobium sp.]
MKKVVGIALLVLVAAQTSPAQGIKFGVGVAGGIDIPVVQNDQGNGSIFGFKGRVKLISAIALEPGVFFTKYGDPTNEDFTMDIEGSKLTSFGIDATLGSGFGGTGIRPYGVFGIGSYKMKRDQTQQDLSKFGWSAGFGIEIGVTAPISLDVRGKLVVIPTEGGGSKKSATVTGGVNYYFGM